MDPPQMNNVMPTSPLLPQMAHQHSYPSLGQITNPYEQQPPGKELNKYASLKAVDECLEYSNVLGMAILLLVNHTSCLMPEESIKIYLSDASQAADFARLCVHLHVQAEREQDGGKLRRSAQGCLSLPALIPRHREESSGKACQVVLDQDKHKEQLSHTGTATQNMDSAIWQMFASLLLDFADEDLQFTSWFVFFNPSFQRTVEKTLERDYGLSDKVNDDFYTKRRHLAELAAKGSLPLHPVRLDEERAYTIDSGLTRQNGKSRMGKIHTHPLGYNSHYKTWDPNDPSLRRQAFTNKGKHGMGDPTLSDPLTTRSQHYLGPQPYFITNSKTEVTV
ncbi:Protein shisa-9 [Lonchura striata]|uniref:Protein shisa-9 n=1 Tax=Lonchura striata TaxID=40157 RepID=A0A218UB91_9PASE|nr:Protein shisa-9 [Lonchura striata domestica]